MFRNSGFSGRQESIYDFRETAMVICQSRLAIKQAFQAALVPDDLTVSTGILLSRGPYWGPVPQLNYKKII